MLLDPSGSEIDAIVRYGRSLSSECRPSYLQTQYTCPFLSFFPTFSKVLSFCRQSKQQIAFNSPQSLFHHVGHTTIHSELAPIPAIRTSSYALTLLCQVKVRRSRTSRRSILAELSTWFEDLSFWLPRQRSADWEGTSSPQLRTFDTFQDHSLSHATTQRF